MTEILPPFQNQTENDNAQALIVNGRDFDPLTTRVEWRQYFPPRDDWVVFCRHAGPLQTIKRTSLLEGLHSLSYFLPKIHHSSDVTSMELNVFDKQKRHQKRMQENKLSHHTTKIHQEHKTDNSHIVTCCSTAYIAKTEGKVYSHAIDNILDRNDIAKIQQKIGKQHAIRKEYYHDYTLPSVKKPKRTTHREFNRKEISEITFTTLPRIPVPDRKGKQHCLESVPRLPLPTTWKWYDNPKQFKKRHFQIDNLFTERKPFL